MMVRTDALYSWGNVRHEYGPGCRKVLENTAGDFIFIEPGVPHEVINGAYETGCCRCSVRVVMRGMGFLATNRNNYEWEISGHIIP
jgi:uncharacterized RmlC-like cupin family protein